jgi:hypothetical protein
MEDGNERINQELKNRKIFSDSHSILGMPALVFVVGICLSLLPIFLFRSFLFGVVFAFCYYIPMLALHKDDVRALSILVACFSDSRTCWCSGRRKKFTVTFIR